jgi:hypothetical protein
MNVNQEIYVKALELPILILGPVEESKKSDPGCENPVGILSNYSKLASCLERKIREIH